MLLHITAKHIKRAQEAQRSSAYYDVCLECVVAQAIRELPGWEDANTNWTTAWVPDKDGNVLKQLRFPKSLSIYIYAFDDRQPVQPETFVLFENETFRPDLNIMP